MGIFSTLAAAVNGVSSTIKGVVDTAQSAFNLHKDINNVDTERSVDAQKELMAEQALYNQQAFDKSADFQRQMFGTQSDFQREMFNRQVEANKESAAEQFAREAFLTSAGRQAYEMRMAGLSPSGNVGSGGTAAAFGAPSPTSPSPTSPTPPNVSSQSAPGSRYTPGSAAEMNYQGEQNRKMQEMLQEREQAFQKQYLDSQTRERNADAYGKEISNIFKYQEHLFGLQKLYFEIIESKNRGEKLDAEKKSILETYPEQIRFWQEQIKIMQQNANANTANANVNQQNANTREAELQETIRNNKINNGIQKALVSLKERGISIDEHKMQPEIDKLVADTKLALANEELTEKNIPYVARKIESEINKNEAMSKALEEQARKTHEEADIVKSRFAFEIAKGTIDSASNLLKGLAPWSK